MKVLQVTVIKKSGDKSITCLHTFLQKHPLYQKYVKKRKKYMVHDEENKTNVGDIIYIKEVRPISKKKSWIVVNKETGEK